LIFKINLTGNPVATDWGKYMIGIDSIGGGDSAGNGWSRPITMPGMDFWIGTWVDSGNGAEVRAFSGTWGLQSATYGSNPDGISIFKDSSSVTIQLKYAGLGLSSGSSFVFDLYASGGGGSDSAIDALANPSQTISGWNVPYNSALTKSYTITPVPEPAAVGVFALAGGLLLTRTFRRRS
jgi:hypothetical protein